MTKIKLLHNSGAGDENHSGEKIKAAIEAKGWRCNYSPLESTLPDIPLDTDFIAIAGGDGTVRKVVKKLLDRKLIEKRFPLAIVPLGTANNLAQFLGIGTDPDAAIEQWDSKKKIRFDVGRIYGLRKHRFFLEGMGYGIFPALMKKMEDVQEGIDDEPEKKLKTALRFLLKIASQYKPRFARIMIDGKDHSGNYILIEVMNSASIGPNLLLAPGARPDDGAFDILLMGVEERDALTSYVQAKLDGREGELPVKPISGKDLFIEWTGRDAHVDDKRIQSKSPAAVKIEVYPELLEFIC